MGPHQDYPPQPVEIELNPSRTLPSPSASAAVHWELPQHTFGEMSTSYAPPNNSRQLHMEGHNRGSAQPLLQWYAENDGPWLPKGVIPEERNSRTKISNRYVSMQQYSEQPHPSDLGTFGAPHSDSGYGSHVARRSDGNASIYSADVAERDQDSHSLAGQAPEFHAYPAMSQVMSMRETPRSETWNMFSNSVPNSTSSLVCPTCHKNVKTRSELKKHDLRHTKPFRCDHQGCTRTEGFSTTNDLDRHVKSKHPSAVQGSELSKRFRCRYLGCKSKDKSWPRLDNFKSHLKRVHHLEKEEDFDRMIQQGEVDSSDLGRVSYPQTISPSQPCQPMDKDTYGPPRLQGGPSNWRPVYPDIISMDALDPKLSPSMESHTKDVLPEQKDSSSGASPRTVQPLEVFSARGKILNHRSTLDDILAPVSLSVPESAVKNTCPTPQPSPQISKSKIQGKATRQNVSASDAKLTEVIKTALVGSKSTPESDEHHLHHILECNSSSSGKSLPEESWSTEQKPVLLCTSEAHINQADSPPLPDNDKDLEAKAIEVLKTLRNSGYIIQESSRPSKQLNPGSAASSKSENLVLCDVCSKFRGRPCELKKHMKRHSRPYGCTFATCTKTFGSKNDWKRHENSQHFHLETWRCIEEKPEGGLCAKVCYRRQTFQEHLKKDHSITTDNAVKQKVEACRIGRNCQARFWCGFCTNLVDLTKKGIDAWTERFDHIDDHFMGRGALEKQSIRDWVPVDSDKPKGDLELSVVDALPTKDDDDSSSASSSFSRSDPEFSGAVAESSTHASHPPGRARIPKRKHSGSSDDDRKTKQAKMELEHRDEMLIVCCQCGGAHNAKLESSCSRCDNAHIFCGECTTTRYPKSKERNA
ncbi:hypothetical protein B0O99DRAFT_651526 [Bisporella sp. PMI_857]|nr:hypothetical protein B0O99DRAFT_651526 [Bisporella sp. PMI_857]